MDPDSVKNSSKKPKYLDMESSQGRHDSLAWYKSLTPFKMTFCEQLNYICCRGPCFKNAKQKRLEAYILESEHRVEDSLDLCRMIKLNYQQDCYLSLMTGSTMKRLMRLQRTNTVLEGQYEIKKGSKAKKRAATLQLLNHALVMKGGATDDKENGASGEKYDDKLDALIEGVFTRAQPEHQSSDQTRAVGRASSLMSQLPDESQRSDGQYVA